MMPPGAPLLIYRSHMYFSVHPNAENLGFPDRRKLHTGGESPARKLLQFGLVCSTTFRADATADRALLLQAVGVTTDVLFALLPIPLVWRVQMRRRLKAAVSAILSLGLLWVQWPSNVSPALADNKG